VLRDTETGKRIWGNLHSHTYVENKGGYCIVYCTLYTLISWVRARDLHCVLHCNTWNQNGTGHYTVCSFPETIPSLSVVLRAAVQCGCDRLGKPSRGDGGCLGDDADGAIKVCGAADVGTMIGG